MPHQQWFVYDIDMKVTKNITFVLSFSLIIGISSFYLQDRTIARERFENSSVDTLFKPSADDAEKILSDDSVVVSGVYATGYYCIYDSEMDGSQTISTIISKNKYNLKASFLFGGYGIAMQGTGRIGVEGDYIKYVGDGGCFVRITGPDAGKNLNGQWIENPKTLRKRYARMGITDFTGFGNLALSHPEKANFSRSSQICGSTGEVLRPWHSIAADPSLINPGQSCKLSFKDGATTPYGNTTATFKAEDTGGNIKGRHIDIYLGEGRAALDQWRQTGGNRYVDVYVSE